MSSDSTESIKQGECYGCSAVLGYLIPWLCKWEAVGLEQPWVMEKIRRLVNRSATMCQGFCKARLVCRLHLKPVDPNCDVLTKAIVKWKCPDCYNERNPRRPDMRWALITNDFECISIAYGRKSNWHMHLELPFILPKTKEEAIEKHTLTSEQLSSLIKGQSVGLPPLKQLTEITSPQNVTRPAPSDSVPTPSDIISLSQLAVTQGGNQPTDVLDNYVSIMTERFHYRPNYIPSRQKKNPLVSEMIVNSDPSSPVKAKPKTLYFKAYDHSEGISSFPDLPPIQDMSVSTQELTQTAEMSVSLPPSPIKRKIGISALLNPY